MHELLIQIIFYVFAAIAVGAAFMVIIQDNPVRSVLSLVVYFFCECSIMDTCPSRVSCTDFSVGVCRRRDDTVPVCCDDA